MVKAWGVMERFSQRFTGDKKGNFTFHTVLAIMTYNVFGSIHGDLKSCSVYRDVTQYAISRWMSRKG